MSQEVARAWEQRDLRKCIELLQRLNRLHPAEPAILLELGRMHGTVFNYRVAEEAFDRAYRIASPGAKATMLAKAGELALDFAASDIAERFLRRATEEKGATSDMFVKLAEVLERDRRMDEACELVERALRMNDCSAVAMLARAHLLNRAGKVEEAERTLRTLLGTVQDRNVRIRAGYELGAVLDRAGRYDEAMDVLLSTKALLKDDAVSHLARRRAMRERVRLLMQSVNPVIIRRWAELGSKLEPKRRLALLGGHPSSGTTLLEQILDSHSDVVSAEETDHFQDYVGNPLDQRWPVLVPILTVLESAPKDVLLGCRESYFAATESCIQSSIGDRLLIDKNPSLTSYILMMIRVFPEISLLVALRDPRDVVVSCFMQSLLPVHAANATWLELETAVEDYISVMTSWRAIAPMLPNPHAEVRYEDLVVDMESTARRVLEFLGVNWDEDVLNFDEHARRKMVRSPTYADVTQKVFTRAVGRWRNYQEYLEPHLPRLEPFVKAFGYG